MLIKQCQYSGKDENGEYIHILRPGYRNRHLIKTATTSEPVLQEIESVMRRVPRSDNLLYTLVSAMGAWEYWGQNSNGDAFPEKALIHTPKDWLDLSMAQKARIGKAWEWGYPTFYNAHAYQHHVNKDPERAFGDIVYAMWDPFMKRVLLILSLDRNKAEALGSISVLDKIENGEYPSVSMGCFPKGTPILLDSGSELAIEEIKKGDIVKTHLGRAGSVENTQVRRYTGTIYDVKVYGYRRRLRLTDEHPVFVVSQDQLECQPSNTRQNRGRRMRQCTPATQKFSKECVGCEREVVLEPSWVRADELCVSDRMLFPVPGRVDDSLSDPSLVEILGYYLAEGYTHNYNSRENAAITFCLSKAKKAVCDRIIELKEHFDVSAYSTYERGEGLYVSLHGCEKLAALCNEHCGKYSGHKRLSPQIMHASPKLQKIFLGAYWKGDGGRYKGTSEGLYFSTASEELANQLFVMLARCDVISSVNEILHEPGPKSVVSRKTVEFQVWVGKQFIHILSDYCGAKAPSLKVVKPYRFFFVFDGVKYIASPIEEIIEEDYDDYVFNFAVEGDDSYVAAAQAVHNCKVPYDLCTRCTDWDRVTGNPRADLENHRKDPIQGLSETTKDYCEHLTNELGRIYSDGVKAGMINLHPRFFDLSYVFIGADKTSRVMAKLAGKCPIRENTPICGNCRDCDISSTHVYDVWTGGREKVASAATRSGAVAVSLLKEDKKKRADKLLKKAFMPEYSSPQEEDRLNKYFKNWKSKRAEIEKRVRSNFEPMLPRMDDREDDLPEDILDDISCDLPGGLRTAGSMGIILKPREFQRTVLVSMGKKPLANELDSRGICFHCGASPERAISMGGNGFLPRLIEKLMPMIEGRSAFGPAFHKRIIIMVSGNKDRLRDGRPSVDEDENPLLRKLSSAYADYRSQVLYKVAADAQRLISEYPQVLQEIFPQALDFYFSSGLAKTGGDMMESLIGTMPTMYLNGAYLERPVSVYVEANPNLQNIVAAGTLATHGRVA